jgi:hypothetical protein
MTMTNNGYPVLEERPLGRPNRRWLARARDISELPVQLPGTVLVFEVGSGYLAFTERRHLAGREELVVNAVSVSLVDARSRTVTAQLIIPSNNVADDFVVLADFRCCVEEPEAVAAAGLRDLSESLRHYLRQDPSLGQIAVRRSVEQINDVRRDVAARIDAYYRLRAPHIAGMSIDLLGVRVVTPKDLVHHKKKMRNEHWRQEHVELEHEGEDRIASRMRSYFEDGPTAVAGLAAARGELDLEKATDREYAALQDKRQDLIKLWESLPEAYRDTVAVDAQRIVDSVFDQILDPGRPARIEGGQPDRSLDAGYGTDGAPGGDEHDDRRG